MKIDLMAEGIGSVRRRPPLGWRIAKALFRRSIRVRARLPLLHTLFTEKEQMLNVAMQYVRFNRIPGDYLEFGSYEGNSFIAAYHFARAQGLTEMQFCAFDSFRGLPAAKGIDEDPDDSTQYYAGDFSCDVGTFRRNLRTAGVSLERVKLVEGYYGDSLTAELQETLPLRRTAVLMVDCDFYESTQQVLDFAGQSLSHGAVVLFDDWYNFKGDPARGEQKAFQEWLERNPSFTATRYMNFGWHGLSFIVHHSGGSASPSR